jgi:hypothetical protein
MLHDIHWNLSIITPLLFIANQDISRISSRARPATFEDQPQEGQFVQKIYFMF